MMFVKANLNNKIKFKLSEKGVERLKDNYFRLFGSKGLKRWPFKDPQKDQEGYVTMQLHEFLEEFGGFYLSNKNNPFESLNVLVEINENDELPRHRKKNS